MEKALIAFSFDDGRLDNYTIARPILKKYRLPATFNITTDYIRNRIDREFFQFPEPMTVQMVREIFSDGLFEIAGHGCQHINTREDIVKGIEDLRLMLGTDMLTANGNGFASPGSDLTESMHKEMRTVFDANNIKYVRISCRYNSFKSLKVYCRKISRIVKWPWLYRIAYQDTLMDRAEEGVIYSIPVLSSVTPSQLLSVVKLAVKQKKACVLMFHSILPKTSIRNTWDYPSESFEKLCQQLSTMQEKDLLTVLPVMNVYTSLNK